MSFVPLSLLFWCAIFVIAGWSADAGWADGLCKEAEFVCSQPYWLVAMAALTAIPVIYREMRE